MRHELRSTHLHPRKNAELLHVPMQQYTGQQHTIQHHQMAKCRQQQVERCTQCSG